MIALHAGISSAGGALVPETQSTADAGAARTRLIVAPKTKACSEFLNICAEERLPHMAQVSVTSGFHHCRGGQVQGSNRTCSQGNTGPRTPSPRSYGERVG